MYPPIEKLEHGFKLRGVTMFDELEDNETYVTYSGGRYRFPLRVETIERYISRLNSDFRQSYESAA